MPQFRGRGCAPGTETICKARISAPHPASDPAGSGAGIVFVFPGECRVPQQDSFKSVIGLDKQGLKPSAAVHWNLGASELAEHALARGEGKLSEDGALVCLTGHHTGRSPNDKF